jgi:F420-dependent oxidoreductase-like protein
MLNTMRIGLPGGGASIERIIEQAQKAEADGFTSLWYATTTIELGTSVLQTYTSHPTLMAARSLASAAAMGRPGFTLGIGPSHDIVIESMFGLSYAHPGRHTEEYARTLAPMLRGEAVAFAGDDLTVHSGARPSPPDPPVSLLLAALAPRLLRVAGELTDGTILWMANARAVEEHVAPRLNKAAADAGRPTPRIVAGLPVAVVDDVDAAREVAATQFVQYGMLPNYQRILDHGGATTPAEVAIVGDEASVTAQIEALFAAGTTDVWCAPFPVGDDRSGSRRRTMDLLRSLVEPNGSARS